MPDTIDHLIQRLTPLLGPPVGEPVHLTGGITNLNYRMRMGEGEFVIRVTEPAAGLLGIDRAAELIALRAAAGIGVGAEVAAVLPEQGCNDLLNANFLHDGQRIRIVDWEYAGMGDRYFDLGNFSINHECEETDDFHLLAGYFGEPVTDRRIAIVRLMRIMSDFREAMWGVVQSVSSTLEFDYEDYAARHFARLLESAAGPRFAAWTRMARDPSSFGPASA
jgi:Choline/ethanolamine kinase